MTKKQTVRKRPKARKHRREFVLHTRMRNNQEAQTERLWTIIVRNFFQTVLGRTTGDIRSFQLYETNSGYHTVYLKDLPATDTRRP